MNKDVGLTFGGRNPKIGVNHIHCSCLCVPLMCVIMFHDVHYFYVP